MKILILYSIAGVYLFNFSFSFFFFPFSSSSSCCAKHHHHRPCAAISLLIFIAPIPRSPGLRGGALGPDLLRDPCPRPILQKQTCFSDHRPPLHAADCSASSPRDVASALPLHVQPGWRRTPRGFLDRASQMAFAVRQRPFGHRRHRLVYLPVLCSARLSLSTQTRSCAAVRLSAGLRMPRGTGNTFQSCLRFCSITPAP